MHSKHPNLSNLSETRTILNRPVSIHKVDGSSATGYIATVVGCPNNKGRHGYSILTYSAQVVIA